jgi:hypothetical protein
MIPLISTSKTVKNLLTSKMNNVFKYFLEKFKMTFSQLTYILWITTEFTWYILSIRYYYIYYFTLHVSNLHYLFQVFI